jgi:molybdopterin synthase catalytic subunit
MERVFIGEHLPSISKIVEQYKTPQTGAIVIFEGKPRNDNGIIALHYEVYNEMAIRELKKIREEILKKFDIQEIFLFHRKGEVKIGETSFVVVVFSKHRKEAFLACSEAVNLVKERVPIWKREVYKDRLGEWILGV